DGESGRAGGDKLPAPAWAAVLGSWGTGSWLLALWACGCLLACSKGPLDSRPPSKAGALPTVAAGDRPDVLMLVSPGLDRSGWNDPLVLAPGTQVAAWMAQGVACESAYVRFVDPERNQADLGGLGYLGNNSEWARQWRQGGYRYQEGSALEREAFFAADANAPGVFVEQLTDSGWAALEAELQALAQAPQPKRPRIRALTAWIGDASQPELCEARLQVPLLFVLPDGLGAGETRPQVVALPDVGATLLDLCGLWPEGTQEDPLGAASFARILLQEPLAWRGYVLAKGTTGGGWIRSARWRLLRTQNGSDLLSLVAEDPNNTRDDSGSPAAAAQMRGMGERLDAWMRR
ncbi:MAG TPA: hypothetical protein P5218_16515, partial [Planctomycetota bacterium]|nr:hypothetical protein [Planctomycetota bacterium]